MKHPWEEIALSDYENHMQLDTVMQLQTMNELMKGQFYRYPARTVMVLGVAGGNGLEHIDPRCIDKVYGVDVNREYLAACAARYPKLSGVLECLRADLTGEIGGLPHADLVIANLLVEYIGYGCFQRVVKQVKPSYVSCVIQINTGWEFVSDSPYLHAFDGLEQVHHQMEPEALARAMEALGFDRTAQNEYPLPNGKVLRRLDFTKRS